MFSTKLLCSNHGGVQKARHCAFRLPRNLEGCWFCGCVCGCAYESSAQPETQTDTRDEGFQNCGKNPTQKKRKKVTLRHVSFSPLQWWRNAKHDEHGLCRGDVMKLLFSEPELFLSEPSRGAPCCQVPRRVLIIAPPCRGHRCLPPTASSGCPQGCE